MRILRKEWMCLLQFPITKSLRSPPSLLTFSLLDYHFMALAFLVNIPFLFKNLFYFISERFFPKTHLMASLVARTWEMTKNRETHNRTVRVGRSDNNNDNNSNNNNRIKNLVRRQKIFKKLVKYVHHMLFGGYSPQG